MYTTARTELGRLKAYHRELGALYREAILTHSYERAHRLLDLRRRVWRAILWQEEWAPETPPGMVTFADRGSTELPDTASTHDSPQPSPIAQKGSTPMTREDALRTFVWLRFLLETGRVRPGPQE